MVLETEAGSGRSPLPGERVEEAGPVGPCGPWDIWFPSPRPTGSTRAGRGRLVRAPRACCAPSPSHTLRALANAVPSAPIRLSLGTPFVESCTSRVSRPSPHQCFVWMESKPSLLLKCAATVRAGVAMPGGMNSYDKSLHRLGGTDPKGERGAGVRLGEGRRPRLLPVGR